MKRSTDYHDYFIRNGKHIGKYEEMYRYSKEIPWHQDKLVHFFFYEMDIALLKQFKYDSILEVGCGLGYFANRLHKELKSNKGGRPKVTGIDISKTAIEKAKKAFPGIRFITADMIESRPLSGERFDLMVVKEVLWCVCHNPTQFWKNTIPLVKNEKFLYISQAFPEGKKWVGQDVIDSPERLKEILLHYCNPIQYCVEWDWHINTGRPSVHFLGRLKKNANK